MKILTKWIKSRWILTRNKNLSILGRRKDKIRMLSVELGKKVVEQENGFFIALWFDESDHQKFESQENGFVFSAREVSTRPILTPIWVSDDKSKIVQMRTDRGMSARYVMVPLAPEAGENALVRERLTLAEAREVLESDPIFSLE